VGIEYEKARLLRPLQIPPRGLAYGNENKRLDGSLGMASMCCDNDNWQNIHKQQCNYDNQYRLNRHSALWPFGSTGHNTKNTQHKLQQYSKENHKQAVTAIIIRCAPISKKIYPCEIPKREQRDVTTT
jgi:hypothetical protein